MGNSIKKPLFQDLGKKKILWGPPDQAWGQIHSPDLALGIYMHVLVHVGA